MVKIGEVSWQERMRDVDFTVVRAQLARKRGVPVTHISEDEVLKHLDALDKQRARDAERVYPGSDRPKRVRKPRIR